MNSGDGHWMMDGVQQPLLASLFLLKPWPLAREVGNAIEQMRGLGEAEAGQRKQKRDFVRRLASRTGPRIGLSLGTYPTQRIGGGWGVAAMDALEWRPLGTMRGRDGHADVVATNQRAGENAWTLP